MALDRFQIEGTPEEVIARLKELMTDGHYYVKVSRLIDEPVIDARSEEFLQRMRARTPEEIEDVRRRTTVYTAPPIVLPPGKTFEDVVREMGPDEPTETDAELSRVLKEMS
jgi:hypothetical protein